MSCFDPQKSTMGTSERSMIGTKCSSHKQREQQKSMEIHIQSIRKATSCIDTSLPLNFSPRGVGTKPYRILDEDRKRLAAIERDNRLLIGRMLAIIERKARTQKRTTTAQTNLQRQQESKRRENDRIEHDNAILKRRMNSVRSQYRKSELAPKYFKPAYPSAVPRASTSPQLPGGERLRPHAPPRASKTAGQARRRCGENSNSTRPSLKRVREEIEEANTGDEILREGVCLASGEHVFLTVKVGCNCGRNIYFELKTFSRITHASHSCNLTLRNIAAAAYGGSMLRARILLRKSGSAVAREQWLRVARMLQLTDQRGRGVDAANQEKQSDIDISNMHGMILKIDPAVVRENAAIVIANAFKTVIRIKKYKATKRGVRMMQAVSRGAAVRLLHLKDFAARMIQSCVRLMIARRRLKRKRLASMEQHALRAANLPTSPRSKKQSNNKAPLQQQPPSPAKRNTSNPRSQQYLSNSPYRTRGGDKARPSGGRKGGSKDDYESQSIQTRPVTKAAAEEPSSAGGSIVLDHADDVLFNDLDTHELSVESMFDLHASTNSPTPQDLEDATLNDATVPDVAEPAGLIVIETIVEPPLIPVPAPPVADEMDVDKDGIEQKQGIRKPPNKRLNGTMIGILITAQDASAPPKEDAEVDANTTSVTKSDIVDLATVRPVDEAAKKEQLPATATISSNSPLQSTSRKESTEIALQGNSLADSIVIARKRSQVRNSLPVVEKSLGSVRTPSEGASSIETLQQNETTIAANGIPLPVDAEDRKEYTQPNPIATKVQHRRSLNHSIGSLRQEGTVRKTSISANTGAERRRSSAASKPNAEPCLTSVVPLQQTAAT